MKILSKDELDRCLLAILGKQEFVDIWWESPNIAFNMETPMNTDWEKVQEYILGHIIR